MHPTRTATRLIVFEAPRTSLSVSGESVLCVCVKLFGHVSGAIEAVLARGTGAASWTTDLKWSVLALRLFLRLSSVGSRLIGTLRCCRIDFETMRPGKGVSNQSNDP